ncbi:MAG: hydroxymethylbilane synthase [Thermodesulfobacteriota bacterium]
MEKKPIKIGTRGSPLALHQARWVQEALSLHHPAFSFELELIKTTGDKIQDVPLSAVGGKGLFVKEIEEALLERRIDLAVHSLKDMPGELPPGLTIGAVPEREDPRDVFVGREYTRLEDVLPGGKIGTSSLRRKAQLLAYRPDLEIIPLRGNLETRLRKMETEDLSGIILAAAGMHRMNFRDRISHYLDLEICLPAVGQGALALEIRERDSRIEEVVRVIYHQATALCTEAERAFLSRLQGGCQVPLAGYACIEGRQLILAGLVAGLDGGRVIKEQMQGDFSNPRDLGIGLAERLLKRGGREILEEVYGTFL